MPLRPAAALLLSLLAGFPASAAPVPPAAITLDGSQQGRVFEGVGALSAGASSRLLIDYPEPYRSQVLDYLFKPHYGASLQHLKVEIGGDVNSTDGCEPSHQHTRTDQNYSRGYEWWLMKEARKRNPHIVLDALEWGAPGWIGNGQFYSQDNADYIVRFLQGARRVYGLDIQYVGIWNEKPYNTEWIKLLRKTLDRAGFQSVGIVAADQVNNWNIVDSINADPALRQAVSRVGVHYPGSHSTPAAQDSGIPLWASEDGPWNGTWSGAERIARTLNRNYIDGKMTETTFWSLVTSYYDNLPLAGSGLMRANTPWSGHYEMQPAAWAVAHTTQFAEPGWKYLAGPGCGHLPGGGSYVTLVSPAGRDFSVVIETMDARATQEVRFHLSGGLHARALHVWRTSRTDWFQRMPNLRVTGDEVIIPLQPDCLYTLTTTSGQHRGSAIPSPAKPFPLPYREDFETYRQGATARYITDWAGIWEVEPRPDGNGNCLEQACPSRGILWSGMGDPRALVGSPGWMNYSVSVDALPAPGGSVQVIGRVGATPENEKASQGYSLSVDSGGRWVLKAQDTDLASGVVSWPEGAWHNLKLSLDMDHIQGFVDGIRVADVTDARFSAGMVGFGGSWGPTRFDNLRVLSGDDTLGDNLASGAMARASSVWDAGYQASAANDGDATTRWNSADGTGPGEWLELDFTRPTTFNTIVATQFEDRITGYKIQVRQGDGWVDVAAGERMGPQKMIRFAPVTSRSVRLLITTATQSVSIYEMEVYNVQGKSK